MLVYVQKICMNAKVLCSFKPCVLVFIPGFLFSTGALTSNSTNNKSAGKWTHWPNGGVSSLSLSHNHWVSLIIQWLYQRPSSSFALFPGRPIPHLDKIRLAFRTLNIQKTAHTLYIWLDGTDLKKCTYIIHKHVKIPHSMHRLKMPFTTYTGPFGRMSFLICFSRAMRAGMGLGGATKVNLMASAMRSASLMSTALKTRTGRGGCK